MNRLNKIIALFIVVVFGVTTYLFLIVNNKKNEQLSTKIVQDDKDNVDKEKKAAKNGYVKMISGDIVQIDNDQESFVVDIDPLGKHQEYKIATDKNTVFEKNIIVQETVVEDDVSEKDFDLDYGERENSQTENTIIKFTELNNGLFVQVYFQKRMDLKNAKDLIAEKVVVNELQGEAKN